MTTATATTTKIVFTTTELGAAIEAIAPAVSTASIWHDHFLMRFTSEALTLVANNGFQGIERDVSYQMDMEADWYHVTLCLPYGPFRRAIAGMPGEVRVTVTEKGVTLQAAGGNGYIGTVEVRAIKDGPEYPPIEIFQEQAITIEDAGKLWRAIGLAKQATSGLPTSSPATLNALHLYYDDNGRLMVEAADGHHAARVEVGEITAEGEEYGAAAPTFRATIPAQHISALKQLEGQVVLSTNGNRISAHNGALRWTSVLVDGKWPDLDPIIHTDPEMYFSVNRQELIARTKAAAEFGRTVTESDRWSRVKYTLEYEVGTLQVHADDNAGTYEWWISAKDPWASEAWRVEQPGGYTFAMDAAQMLSGLAGIDADEVEVSLHNGGRMLHLVSEKQHHLLSVVMA